MQPDTMQENGAISGGTRSRSGVGAELNVDAIAVSASLARFSLDKQRYAQLAGGDDYELIFTAPKSARRAIGAFGDQAELTLSRIGHIKKEMGLHLINVDGETVTGAWSGFDHFRNE